MGISFYATKKKHLSAPRLPVSRWPARSTHNDSVALMTTQTPPAEGIEAPQRLSRTTESQDHLPPTLAAAQRLVRYFDPRRSFYRMGRLLSSHTVTRRRPHGRTILTNTSVL